MIRNFKSNMEPPSNSGITVEPLTIDVNGLWYR